METIWLVVQQTLMMFILIGIGFLLYTKGYITKAGSKDMASVLVTIVIPAVIIDSFAVEYSPQKAQNLALCTLLAALMLGIAIIVGRLLFKKRAIDNFAVAFSNPGFFGIPLITAALGGEAVLYVTPFIVGLNVLQFSYGMRLISDKGAHKSIKNFLKNPIFISAVLGVAIFFLQIPMPTIISKPIGMVAAMNAPLAMLVMGVYLAQTDFKTLFTTPSLYATSAARLIAVPLVTIVALIFIPTDIDVRQALLIAAACPVGANVAVYTQLAGKNYGYAVQTVVHSTLFCIISLPLVLLAAQLI